MKKKKKDDDVEGAAEQAAIDTLIGDELKSALKKLGSIGGKKSARVLTAKERKERATKPATHGKSGRILIQKDNPTPSHPSA